MNTIHIPTDHATAIVHFDDYGHILTIYLMQPYKRIVPVPLEHFTPEDQSIINSTIITELDERRYEKS